MSFLDRKEEVVDLILTRRGRELLALGRLNPTYYGFYDDEIVYDPDYAFSTSSIPAYDGQVVTASTEQQQHRIAHRIRDSIYSKNQTGYQEAQGVLGTGKEKSTRQPFKILGKSSLLDQEKPAWELNIIEQRGYISGRPSGSAGSGDAYAGVKFLPLEFSSSVPDAFSDVQRLQQSASLGVIPQINVFCDYEVSVYQAKDFLSEEFRKDWLKYTPEKRKELISEIAEELGGEVLIALDRSSDDLYIELKEHNVDNTADNFILEVFQYEYSPTTYSTNKKADTISDIKQKQFSDTKHDQDIVGYYFDLSYDDDSLLDEKIKFVDDISLLDELDGRPDPECGPAADSAAKSGAKPRKGSKDDSGAYGGAFGNLFKMGQGKGSKGGGY